MKTITEVTLGIAGEIRSSVERIIGDYQTDFLEGCIDQELQDIWDVDPPQTPKQFHKCIDGLCKKLGKEGAATAVLGLLEAAFKKKLILCLNGMICVETNEEDDDILIPLRMKSITSHEGISSELNMVAGKSHLLIRDCYVTLGMKMQK